TRPDLLYALQELATVAHAPGHDALVAIKRVFRYLLGTKDYFLQVLTGDTLTWTSFIDAGYAAGANVKSTAGHIIFLGSTAIQAQSKTIRHVVDSTAQAEAYALQQAIREIQFLQNIAEQIQIPFLNITVYTDSKALHDFSFKSGTGKRSRHWNLTLHNMKQHIGTNKLIDLKLIVSTDNTADILTKALGASLFHKFRSQCGLTINPKEE
ncbi:MAG TPA: Ty1/Copia family ribonuclease HI, partial [Sphingobacteriaceae bacterium]